MTELPELMVNRSRNSLGLAPSNAVSQRAKTDGEQSITIQNTCLGKNRLTFSTQAASTIIMPSMETESSNTSRAEELKFQANEAFQAHKYSLAIDLYTQAIELNCENAVYWANRAFAHTKLEEYGSAIQDATKAVEIDPRYSKGYYRRGAAHLAMGKFKEALKDFQQNRGNTDGFIHLLWQNTLFI
ncbi:unnamed protein product [Ilex paraguariensis]|uniref:Uncharacterized protein n=1 Tax=Ilex paraguariensis TaxID=185542 RepID=A0ABC8U7Z8_9AQUA